MTRELKTQILTSGEGYVSVREFVDAHNLDYATAIQTFNGYRLDKKTEAVCKKYGINLPYKPKRLRGQAA